MIVARNEGDVKKLVKRVLDDVGCGGDPTSPLRDVWYFMPSANGYGRQGIPDFVGCAAGRMFAIETKFGGNTLTAHQLRELDAVKKAGSNAWIVRESTFGIFEREFRDWVQLYRALES